MVEYKGNGRLDVCWMFPETWWDHLKLTLKRKWPNGPGWKIKWKRHWQQINLWVALSEAYAQQFKSREKRYKELTRDGPDGDDYIESGP